MPSSTSSRRRPRQPRQEGSGDQRQDASRTLVVSSRGMTPVQALERLSGMIENRNDQLLALVQDPAIAERLKMVALHALAEPKLAEKLAMADLATVIEAIRDAAMMDLMPTGIGNEGWLVPYWNSDKSLYDIQFQPGWRGLAKLLAPVAEIAAGVAYVGDVFEFELGSTERVRHVPALKDRGDRLAVWADATLVRTGNHRVVIMDMDAIDRRRRASKMADAGAWRDWFDEMARKTAVRALCNLIPAPPRRLAAALETEARIEQRYAELADARPVAAIPGKVDHAERARRLLAGDVGDNGTGGPPGDRAASGQGPGADAPAASDDPARAGEPAAAEPPHPAEAGPAGPAPDEGVPAAAVPRPSPPGESPAAPASGTNAGAPHPEAVSGDVVCGAASDARLGPVMVCDKPAGHTGAHRSTTGENEGTWPNEARSTSKEESG